MVEGALATKLSKFMALSRPERTALEALGTGASRIAAKSAISKQTRRRHGALLHSGWACRYRTLRDGRRQILGFILPGDFCDPSVLLIEHTPFSIDTITPCVVSQPTAQDVIRMGIKCPRLAIALWWTAASEQNLLQHRLISLGRLTAKERLAYLALELWRRLQLVELSLGPECPWPLTHEDVADALGLTPVHVSRMFKALKSEGVMQRSAHRLRILDMKKLERTTGLEPGEVGHLSPRREVLAWVEARPAHH